MKVRTSGGDYGINYANTRIVEFNHAKGEVLIYHDGHIAEIPIKEIIDIIDDE